MTTPKPTLVHARHAAEEPEVWRRNRRDGTWRRSGGVSQSGPVTSAQGDLWRPWVAQEEKEETVSTIVSVADPDNYNCEARVKAIIARETGMSMKQIGGRPWPATSTLSQRWPDEAELSELEGLMAK